MRRDIKQTIIKNTASLLFGGLASQFLSFLAVVYLARILGPSDFGKINFAMAVVIYFTLVADLGLPILGTREIARQKNKVRDYLGNILSLRFILALLAFAALLVFTYFLNKPLEIKQLLIIFGLGLFTSALLPEWAFQGMQKMEYVGLGKIVANLLFLVLVLKFVNSSQQLSWIPWIRLGSAAVAMVLLLFLIVRLFGWPRFNFNFSILSKLLSKASPLGLSLIMAQIFYNIDTVMLGFMRTDAEVGYYNAAYKIILVIIFLAGSYHDAIFPLLSNYYKTSLDSLKRLLRQTQKLMAILGFPIVIGGAVLARPIINLLYKSVYSEAAVAFQILIWSVIIIYFNTTYSRGLVACNREKWFLLGTTIPAIFNIAANYLLIPRFGISGAAFTTVLSEMLGFAIMFAGFGKITHVPFLEYCYKPLIASVGMMIFLLWGLGRDLNLFVLIGNGIIFYTGFLFLIRGITLDDFGKFKRVFINETIAD
ncbi:hypothetical protein A3F86_03330 [candidate division WOR-1 bacterium RIFCSPLOWO2_12_FULL_45_9]|uniref:Uncharacterized protein n=1 Tax=candidate division WOR-1 bacterium RIFCSPLOWO2_12_FULL_45_9 TaxID=1802568 RepID=A0A1F4RPM1_UNCSA|nr:MAG: hypothetical protein A3F86_03330 [candidate division WOR-1 bacterium RIFCSPLOWO2_12_FULL_45_9]